MNGHETRTADPNLLFLILPGMAGTQLVSDTERAALQRRETNLRRTGAQETAQRLVI